MFKVLKTHIPSQTINTIALSSLNKNRRTNLVHSSDRNICIQSTNKMDVNRFEKSYLDEA